MTDLVPKIPARRTFKDEQELNESVNDFMVKLPDWCVLRSNLSGKSFPAEVELDYNFKIKCLTITY